MDIQHNEKHLVLGLRMLHSHRDTKDISFGLVNKDWSIHSDFRLLAVDYVPSKSEFMKLACKKEQNGSVLISTEAKSI